MTPTESSVQSGHPAAQPLALASCTALAMPDVSFDDAVALLMADGFESAGEETVFGLCLAGCTLFVELDLSAQCARSWLLDASTFEFIGKTYEVSGPWAEATVKARHLVDASYAQERLSGGLERYSMQERETWAHA